MTSSICRTLKTVSPYASTYGRRRRLPSSTRAKTRINRLRGSATAPSSRPVSVWRTMSRPISAESLPKDPGSRQRLFQIVDQIVTYLQGQSRAPRCPAPRRASAIRLQSCCSVACKSAARTAILRVLRGGGADRRAFGVALADVGRIRIRRRVLLGCGKVACTHALCVDCLGAGGDCALCDEPNPALARCVNELHQKEKWLCCSSRLR